MPYFFAKCGIVSEVELYRFTIFLSLELKSFAGFRPRSMGFGSFKTPYLSLQAALPACPVPY
jgi:hypothetical protein